MQSVGELRRQLRALASRSRLQILQLLAAAESMTVTELREQVHISQPLLSWHLSILRRAGVGGRNQGRSASPLRGQPLRSAAGYPRTR